MTTRLQRGRIASSYPKWIRTLALLCVVLVGFISTVEAVHIHGEWLPKNAACVKMPAAASQGQGEEHCPLCVAMHSALPVTIQVAPEAVQEFAQPFAAHAPAAPQKLWSFATFSRPPPVAERTLAANNASEFIFGEGVVCCDSSRLSDANFNS